MCNFESFSEDLVPRIVPRPTLIPSLDNSKPLVPEISILVDDSAQTETIVPRQPTSYKEWKQNQNKNQQMYRNGNASANAFSANGTGGEKKKNVKFNLSPDDLNTNSEQQFKLPIDQAIDENLAAQCNQLDLSLCEPTIVDNAKGNQNCGANRQQFSDNRLTGDSMQNNLRQQNVKHFRDSSKQLSNPQCMHQTANAVTWNRNVNNEQQEINLDDVYRLLQNIQQKNVATPQLYEPPMPTQNHLRNAQQNLVLHDNQQPIVPPNEVNVGQMSNSEPTIKDLFSVIVKQQEQLLNIQKQVHMLLMNPRSVGAAHNHFQGGPDFNQLNGRPKPMGVMTSFEINVQPCKPRMSLQPNEIHKSQNVCNDIEAKTSSEPKKCSCNCSCGVLETVKQTSKPVQSSDSESNDENSDSFQNGWAFYGNILNQVNNVLQNSPQITKPNQHPIETIATNHQNLFERTDEYHVQQNQFTPNITKTVRSAQIKQVGFQFDDVNISATSKRITFESTPHKLKHHQSAADRVTPTEESMLMNTLAGKYLCIENKTNGEQFTNLLQNRVTQSQAVSANTAIVPPQYSHGSNPTKTKPPPDMSLTSYRYMEKYGLL